MASKLLSLALLSCAVFGVDKGQQKIEIMKSLEAAESDSIIKLDGDQYMQLVVENPRPYHVVMLYTVQTRCDHCQLLYPEMQTAVYSFKKQEEKLSFPTFYCVLIHN